MQTRRNVFLWVLYDFANSIVAVVFFLYFAQWIVVERGMSDFAFNATFTIAGLLLLATVPVTGMKLDSHLRRITGLRYSTFFTGIFYGLCALSAYSGNNRLALVSFSVATYVYLLSFTFYTPLLTDIAHEKKRGLVSGLGIMANYIGQFVGLLIALPFSNGTLSLFGMSPRAETFAPAIAAFLIFSLPMLLFFSEDAKTLKANENKPSVMRETKFLLAHGGVLSFLLAYFLFNDAMLTVVNNFPLYLEQVWLVSDTVKTYIMLAILVTCAVGGFLGGVIADRVGHKRSLLFILVGWVFLFPFVGLIRSFPWFVFACVCLGLWYGATWTVSRSVMGYLAPPGKQNLTFGYFGLAERASSILGPMVWSAAVTAMLPIGPDRYRFAIVGMTLFIVFGMLVLLRVPGDRKES